MDVNLKLIIIISVYSSDMLIMLTIF